MKKILGLADKQRGKACVSLQFWPAVLNSTAIGMSSCRVVRPLVALSLSCAVRTTSSYEVQPLPLKTWGLPFRQQQIASGSDTFGQRAHLGPHSRDDTVGKNASAQAVVFWLG